MRKGILCILWALLGPALQAAEIVGWKTPLREFVFEELNAPGVVRCEPPEPSAFFNEGDELWDLGGVPDDHRADIGTRPNWVVWNATTRRLVTKTTWDGVWAFHRLLEFQNAHKRCRLKTEILRVSPPDADAEPVASIVLRCGSKAKFESAIEFAAGKLHIDGEAEISADTPHVLVKFGCTFSIDNQPSRTLKTTVTLRDSMPLWVVRDTEDGTGADLRITAQIELPDGTPAAEAILIDRHGERVALVPNFGETIREPLPDEKQLLSLHVEPKSIWSLDPNFELEEEEWDPSDGGSPPLPLASALEATQFRQAGAT